MNKKLYVVIEHVDYEGSNLEGIFDNYEDMVRVFGERYGEEWEFSIVPRYPKFPDRPYKNLRATKVTKGDRYHPKGETWEIDIDEWELDGSMIEGE